MSSITVTSHDFPTPPPFLMILGRADMNFYVRCIQRRSSGYKQHRFQTTFCLPHTSILESTDRQTEIAKQSHVHNDTKTKNKTKNHAICTVHDSLMCILYVCSSIEKMPSGVSAIIPNETPVAKNVLATSTLKPTPSSITDLIAAEMPLSTYDLPRLNNGRGAFLPWVSYLVL